MSEIQIDVSSDSSFQRQSQNVQSLPYAKQTVSPCQAPASAAAKSVTPVNAPQTDTVKFSADLEKILEGSAQFLTSTENPNNVSAVLQNGSLNIFQNGSTFTASYTQNNGGSFSLTFNQNIAIQENDDASASVFFERDNITKQFMADGTVLEFQGNTLASSQKSVLVNTTGGTVNTENGTVIALADNTAINAEGDSTIILKHNSSNTTINVLNGSSTIKGQNLENSTINASNADLNLQFFNINNSAITTQQGNIQLKALNLKNSALNLGAGTHSMDFYNAQNNTVDFTANSIDNQSTLNILNSGTNNTVNMHGEKTNIFIRYSRNNSITSDARWTTSHFTSSENDNINYDGYWASINGGNISGSKINVNSSQTFSMNVHSLNGTSTVYADSPNTSLYLGEITDNAKLNITGQHFVAAHIGTISGNASLNLNSWYYSNVYIDKMLGNALISINSNNANISVNSMEDNAAVDLGDSTVNGIFGHIEGNAQITGGTPSSNVLIAKNGSEATENPNYADFSKLTANERNKAFSSFMTAVIDSPSSRIAIPHEFRLNAVL